jgi:hypothetical protein
MKTNTQCCWSVPFDSDEGFVEPKPTKTGNVFSNKDFYGGSQDYDE